MSVHVIAVNMLSPDALHGVIEEFVSRGGTDYGEGEASLESNIRQVKHQLEKGLAVLVYDDQSETTNILVKDDPLLKKIENRF
jgi:hypothetical protein